MNKPNTDIASDGSLAGALSSAFRNLMMNTEDMLPATVVSYDDKTNRAVIKPLVMMVTTEGELSGEHRWPIFPFLDLGEAVSLFAHRLNRVISVG